MRVLTVSEVRKHLYWADGGPRAGGSGTGSIALLGRIFHELYAALTGPNDQLNLGRPLELADSSLQSWSEALITHAFSTVIAPALAQHESVLQPYGREVLGFWTAAQQLCAWLAGVMHDLHATDGSRSLESWRKQIFTRSEMDLALEFSDPSWPESIQLQGRADALLSRPGDRQSCIVEFKLGRSHPSADLLQGCLYHLMLTGSEPTANAAALAVVSFAPERHEQLFDAGALEAAHAALKALLGELVGFASARAGSSAAPKKTPPQPLVGTPSGADSTNIQPVPDDQLHDMKRKLTSAFAEFGTPLTIADETLSGPAFVRFFASPQRGVAAKRIAQIGPNVWMRLGTDKPPQISLQGGRVTIDVQRSDRQPVNFADWRTQIISAAAGRRAVFAVGVRVDGKLHLADLSESQSPHLLVVGTTGSGKSEWLRAFIASLMLINTPATLRFALIDPKRLAFSSLDGSQFLWRPVIHDDRAIELLDELIEEMESRYATLQKVGVEDINAYHSTPGGTAAPFFRLVCICDEFADLVLRDKRSRSDIESRVARLGVKGRAAGVHLVFATQRAGREVLKGTIDSNLPGRVALTVARDVDSRLILGEPGAEALLGRGDLLYKDIGNPVRLQGLHVTREDLDELAD